MAKKNTTDLATALASLVESDGTNYYLSKIMIDNITAELKDTYARTLKDGVSVEDGKSIDNVKDNGFYHQVGDWSGTLPTTYSGDWHYSNLLAFNCGVDVTVQLLFHYKKSVFAIRTGRGESTTWQDWVVYNAPNDLDSVIKAINTSISTLQSDVSTLKSDVSTLKSDVSTLKSDVSTLKSDNTDNKAKISSLETNVTTLYNEVLTKQDIVDNLNSYAQNKPLSAYQGKVLNDSTTKFIKNDGVYSVDTLTLYLVSQLNDKQGCSLGWCQINDSGYGIGSNTFVYYVFHYYGAGYYKLEIHSFVDVTYSFVLIATPGVQSWAKYQLSKQ